MYSEIDLHQITATQKAHSVPIPQKVLYVNLQLLINNIDTIFVDKYTIFKISLVFHYRSKYHLQSRYTILNKDTFTM